MGRTIYLTDREILALTDTASEWCSMMEEGNINCQLCVGTRLADGLGSAFKKLYKGTNGEHIYEKY